MSTPNAEASVSGLRLNQRLAVVLGRVIFVCLLAVMVITIIPYGTVDPWWEALFECAVLGLTVLWIGEVLLRGSWQVNKLLILLPLFLLTAYAFFQTIQLPGAFVNRAAGPLGSQRTITIDQYQTHLTAVKALALTVFTALLLLHTSSSRRLSWLVRVIIGIGLGSAVFGILRQLLQSPSSTNGFVLPFLFYGAGYGQFISPNAFAYVAEMAFALLLGLLLGGAARRDRIPLYLAVGALIWTALILSSSRGGILAMVCQSIFLMFTALSWYSRERVRRAGRDTSRSAFISAWVVRLLVVVVIAAILVLGVFWMGGDQLAAKQANNQNGDGTTRSEIWRSTWKLIKENPLTGVGFGAYFLAIPEYQSGSGRLKVQQAHNEYLDLAANGGIVAVGLALWFIAMVIWRARYFLKSGDAYKRAACLGAIAGILSVSIHSFFDFGLQLTGIAVLFAGLIVIAIATPIGTATAERRTPGSRAGHRPRL